MNQLSHRRWKQRLRRAPGSETYYNVAVSYLNSAIQAHATTGLYEEAQNFAAKRILEIIEEMEHLE